MKKLNESMQARPTQTTKRSFDDQRLTYMMQQSTMDTNSERVVARPEVPSYMYNFPQETNSRPGSQAQTGKHSFACDFDVPYSSAQFKQLNHEKAPEGVSVTTGINCEDESVNEISKKEYCFISKKTESDASPTCHEWGGRKLSSLQKSGSAPNLCKMFEHDVVICQAVDSEEDIEAECIENARDHQFSNSEKNPGSELGEHQFSYDKKQGINNCGKYQVPDRGKEHGTEEHNISYSLEHKVSDYGECEFDCREHQFFDRRAGPGCGEANEVNHGDTIPMVLCKSSTVQDHNQDEIKLETNRERKPFFSCLISLANPVAKFRLNVSIRSITVGLVVCVSITCLTVALVQSEGLQENQADPPNPNEKFHVPMLQKFKRLARNARNGEFWIRFKYNEYKIIPDTLKWLEAKLRCASSNASLVYITDQAENNVVTKIGRDMGISLFHIALKRFEKNGWFWIQRKSVDIVQPIHFSNWYVDYDASKEPYEATGYIEVSDGKWRADWQDQARPSICKRPTEDAEEEDIWPGDESSTLATNGKFLLTAKPSAAGLLATTKPPCTCKCADESKPDSCQCIPGVKIGLCKKRPVSTTKPLRDVVNSRPPDDAPTAAPVIIPKGNNMATELGVVFIVCISLITISILSMIILLIKWKMAIHKSRKEAVKKMPRPSISDHPVDTMSKVYVGCDDDGYETIDDSHIEADHSHTDAGDGQTDAEEALVLISPHELQTDGEEALVLISPHELQDMYITQPCIFTYGRSGLVPSGL